MEDADRWRNIFSSAPSDHRSTPPTILDSHVPTDEWFWIRFALEFSLSIARIKLRMSHEVIELEDWFVDHYVSVSLTFASLSSIINRLCCESSTRKKFSTVISPAFVPSTPLHVAITRECNYRVVPNKNIFIAPHVSTTCTDIGCTWALRGKRSLGCRCEFFFVSFSRP